MALLEHWVVGKRVEITYTCRNAHAYEKATGVVKFIETSAGCFAVLDDKIYINSIYIVKIEVKE